MNVRRATQDDAAAVAQVLRLSFTEYEPMYTPAAYAATTPPREQILERMREGPIWVAGNESDLVGTAAALSRPDGLYIRGMAVIPAARGLRIGALMLDTIEDFALESGQRRLYLSTTPFLDSAIRLYQRYGFRRTNTGPQHLHGTPLFTMEKQLL